ncbi:aminoglycoside phosphotransferase [Leuconostoc litchii]|uniref:Fructosamine kinase n=1 Tax=Leuconostoc litchii TaxID=1981069 RepID=A0A6P2CQ84_9LACO|nr:fructosamine kinase family protein [Leuconostoc litchii]TYC47272.1 fructosamine kinase [Leuconostoc litchii]GMA69258.1 aminoglycoside phosphotransferase [Leuconostoc litchii]
MNLGKDFISRLGLEAPHDVQKVRGGDINEAFSLYSNNKRYFLKIQQKSAASFFDHEVAGLNALSEVVTVPRALTQGQIKGNAYLMLSWINQGNGLQQDLARELVKLHQKTTDKFGFDSDNLVDFVPKNNTWKKTWAEFFVEQRLDPLMAQARKNNFWLTQRGDHYSNLRKKILNDIHAQSVRSSLLHGDFWAGNFMFNETGQPIFIDPNVFYGDREYDIAISKVFPGFDSSFYETYMKEWPLDKGWQERMRWYEFYYILMHFIRFGDLYAPRLNKLLTSF